MRKRSLTPEERNAYRAEWRRRDRAAHPEKYAAAKKRHYATHRADVLARSKEYQESHRDRIIERKRVRYASWDPEERRNYTIMRLYGISTTTYDAMYTLQNGRCLICEEAHDQLDIDHCHKAGHVRGLLCGKCNRGIGFMRDDPRIATRAAAYLSNRKLAK